MGEESIAEEDDSVAEQMKLWEWWSTTKPRRKKNPANDGISQSGCIDARDGSKARASGKASDKRKFKHGDGELRETKKAPKFRSRPKRKAGQSSSTGEATEGEEEWAPGVRSSSF